MIKKKIELWKNCWC